MSARPTLKVGADLLVTPEGRKAARDVSREQWAVYMLRSNDRVLERLGATLVCYAAARAVTSAKRAAARRRDLERQKRRNDARRLRKEQATRFTEALAEFRAENVRRLS